MKLRAALVLIAVLGLLMPACGGKEEPAGTGGGGGDTGGGTAMTGTKAIDPATVGTISGMVKFSGEAPKMGLIDTEADKDCHAMHQDDPLHRETVIVNENGTLKDVIVYVKKGLSDYKMPPPPTEPAVIDQHGCRYEPHTLTIEVGQPLEIRNSDPTKHNIHFVSKLNGDFNVSQNKDETILRSGGDAFKRRELGTCYFKCEFHSWMKSNLGIFDHPFHAVTGEDGSFSISGLPPGNYTIAAWHELYGERTVDVVVGASESKTAGFEFTAD